MRNRAIFLVNDGIVLERGTGSPEPADMALGRGTATALPLLYASGYRLVLVAARPAAGAGSKDMTNVERRLRELLEMAGVQMGGFYYCQHTTYGAAGAACSCYPPRPGMLQRAAGEQRLDLGASWLVCDTLDAVESAHLAGSRAVLVDNGREREWNTTDLVRRPEGIAFDLAEAALMIASSLRGGIRTRGDATS